MCSSVGLTNSFQHAWFLFSLTQNCLDFIHVELSDSFQ